MPPNGKTFELVLTACAQAEEEEDWLVSKGEWWWVEPQSQRRLKGLLMMWHWHVQSHVVGGIAVTRGTIRRIPTCSITEYTDMRHVVLRVLVA